MSEHALETDCWCGPTPVDVPGTDRRVWAHHDTMRDEAEQADRAALVFEAADQIAVEVD